MLALFLTGIDFMTQLSFVTDQDYKFHVLIALKTNIFNNSLYSVDLALKY